jgi:hypothetical protein
MQGIGSLVGAHIGIYGVGAIGRQVALALATMGCKKLTLIDPDIVEGPNMGTQGYCESSFRQLKTDATAKECKARNSTMEINTKQAMVGKKKRVGDKLHWAPTKGSLSAIFVCVDDMITRKEIFDIAAYHPADVLVDTRMGAFAARVIADEPPFPHWEQTLFADSAAFTGRCTLQSTFFAANVCAGLAVSALGQFYAAKEKRVQKGGLVAYPFEPLDFIIDMLDFDITHQPRANPEMEKLKLLEGNLQVVNLGDIGSGGVAFTMADLLRKARKEAVKAGVELEPIDIAIEDDWHSSKRRVVDDGKEIQSTERQWND